MSTKIWEAYRVPLSKLNEFTDIFRDAYREAAYQYIRLFVDGLKEEIVTEAIEDERTASGMFPFLYKDKLSEAKYMRLAKLGWVLFKATEDAGKLERSAFDLNCGFNFWIRRGYAYIIPIVQLPYGARPKIKWPDWVKDFHYQNSADRDEDITEREWRHRESTWDKLNCGKEEDRADHNSRRYFHTVIEMERHLNSDSVWYFRDRFTADERRAEREEG